MIEKFGLTHCVVTLGDRGSFVATNNDKHAYVPGFAIEMVDPCGAGDAFTAGFVHMLLRDQPLEVCCTLGNALGAMVAGQYGCTKKISGEEIESFIASERLRVIEPLLEPYTVVLEGGISWTT